MHLAEQRAPIGRLEGEHLPGVERPVGEHVAAPAVSTSSLGA